MINRFFSNYFQSNPPRFQYGLFTSTKTKLLMEDRKIELYVRQHISNPFVKVELLEGIEKLQSKIYKLDKYGEKNWYLNFSKIQKLWNNISLHIISLGFSESQTDDLLAKMQSYMQVEIAIRKNSLPNKISISEYYELKICDVHLQRMIIKSKAKTKFNESYYRIWEIIDIISEILDDVNDINEDCKDYNCNRLLISNHQWSTNIIIQDYFHYCNSIIQEFEEILPTQEHKFQDIFNSIVEVKMSELRNKLNNLDLTNCNSRIFEKLDFNNNNQRSINPMSAFEYKKRTNAQQNVAAMRV